MNPIVYAELSRTNGLHSTTYNCRVFVEELVDLVKEGYTTAHIYKQTRTLCTLVLSATQGAGKSKAKRVIDRYLAGSDYELRINPKNIRLAPKEDNFVMASKSA